MHPKDRSQRLHLKKLYEEKKSGHKESVQSARKVRAKGKTEDGLRASVDNIE